MSEKIKDDFIGFTFNDIHSSEIGIIRTSNGDRYEQMLVPEFEDKTIDIPGNDGTYFYGSYYTNRTFSIPIAFDSMSEIKFRRLSNILGDKQIHKLIFDEVPYKVYYTKISGAQSLEYLCFDELDTNGRNNRVYKGEGTLEFIAYNPFAYSINKYLSQYSRTDYPNIDEWKDASGLLENQTIIIGEQSITFDKFNLHTGNSNKARIYNPGDLSCDWQLQIDFINNTIKTTDIHILNNSTVNNKYQITLKEIITGGSEDSILLDSKTRLIYGMYNGVKTGRLFNEYIDEGDFFQIPTIIDFDNPVYFELTSQNEWSEQDLSLLYNYRYY